MSSCRRRLPFHLRLPSAADTLVRGVAALAFGLLFGVQAQAGPATAAAAAARYPNIGREATPREIAAWDIDVRPDFKGLPPGSGSVAKGQDVWEAKCASCHGVFGESGEVFNPLVGGTTADDVKTGRVASLRTNSFPGRTTLMKLSTVSTLWDYINRAMPWTAPKSLSTEEVYAVTAYLLNLGGVVPDDFTLSNTNIASVQARLPNRNGMQTRHGLWPDNTLSGGTGSRPDVRATACMRDCVTESKVASFIPEHARNNHGNLADQNRPLGPQRGVQTAGAAAPGAAAQGQVLAANVAAGTQANAPAARADVSALLQKYSCTACHGMAQKIVGPSFQDIASKHAGKPDYLAGKIRSGSSGVWGQIPMPPQSPETLGDADLAAVAQWLAAGKLP